MYNIIYIYLYIYVCVYIYIYIYLYILYIYLATECCGGYYEHAIFALNSGGLSREKIWALNLGDGVEFFLINY